MIKDEFRSKGHGEKIQNRRILPFNKKIVILSLIFLVYIFVFYEPSLSMKIYVHIKYSVFRVQKEK